MCSDLSSSSINNPSIQKLTNIYTMNHQCYLGRTETFWYNDLYMLDLQDNSSSLSATSTEGKTNGNLAWIENVMDPLSDSSGAVIGSTGLNSKAIAGTVVGIVIALIMAFILWKYWSVLFTYFIWNPR